MDPLRRALGGQYRAGLEMLAESIARCPDDLWLAGEPGRETWRIAFHTAFFTQVYLGQDEAAYAAWPEFREDLARILDPAYCEPYEFPPETVPIAREELGRYVAHVREFVGPTIDGLDLAASESGFVWYEGWDKLAHVLMNLRHLHHHVGQLTELLLARGIEVEWSGRA